MCGLAGFVRTRGTAPQQWPVIRAAFEGINIRGRHASGYASLTETKTWVSKAPITSVSMAKRKTVRQNVRAGSLAVFHARYATQGDPKNNNTNHPFWSEDGRYVLVHNGVIHDNPEDMIMPNGVDSEIALAMIEKYGIIEAANQMNEWDASDFAILVIDTQERALYAFRNEGRPMVFSNMTDAIGGYVIASTEAILEKAMKRGKASGDIIGTLPYTLYKFTPGQATVEPQRLDRFEEWLEIASRPKPKYAYAGQYDWRKPQTAKYVY